MSTETFTLRLDGDLKVAASAVAEYYGLDLPSVTRAFFTQMVREHAIPLNLAAGDPFDAEANQAYLRRKAAQWRDGSLSFAEHGLIDEER